MDDEAPSGLDTPDEREGGKAKEAADLVLAYLSCPQDAAKNFLGALLITDARSRPLHFAYVSPVRPTTMQRILYGSTLSEHIRVDVITKKLFTDGVPRVPDVLFVDDEDLLAARRIDGVPTAYLSRPPDAERDSTSLSIVRYSTGGNTVDDETVGRIVANLEQAIDLLDPFNRVREALKEALKGE